VERDKAALGEDHPEVAVDLVKLGAVYRDMIKLELAENIFAEAHLIFEQKFPDTHHRVGEFYLEWGRLKIAEKNFDSASNYLQKSLGIFLENFDEGHQHVISVTNLLADISRTN